MKKLLGLFILGLLVSSAAFARSTVCYKIAQGQITEEKDFVSYNYVCIEKLEGNQVPVCVKECPSGAVRYIDQEEVKDEKYIEKGKYSDNSNIPKNNFVFKRFLYRL